MSLPNVQTAVIRTFTGRDLDASDRIARHILRGGLAVLEGPWERVLGLRESLLAKGAPKAALRLLALRAGADPIRTEVPGLRALRQNGLIALEDALFARAGHLQHVDALGGAVTTVQTASKPTGARRHGKRSMPTYSAYE